MPGSDDAARVEEDCFEESPTDNRTPPEDAR